MRELPCTSKPQNHKLQKCPSNHPGIRRLRLISELSFPFLWSTHSLAYTASNLMICFYLPTPHCAMCNESRTLWKTCSRRMSCNLAFKSLTLCTISESLPLSALSIWLVSPVARSNDNLIPPTGIPLANHPPLVPACAGVKQIR